MKNYDLRSKISNRLAGYDYSQPGGYFVTICTDYMKNLFGRIKNGVMNMISYGDVIQKEWFFNASNRPYMELYEEEFIVMPNHIHGIIWIMVGEEARTSGESKSRMIIKTNSHGPSPGSLGAIIGHY